MAKLKRVWWGQVQKSENNLALASAATVLNATDKPGCLVTQSLDIVAANTAWKNLLGKASGDGETELDRHVRPLYSLNKVDYREVAKAIGFIAMPCVLVRAPKGERPRFHMLFIPDVAANIDLVVLLAPRALDDALALEVDLSLIHI